MENGKKLIAYDNTIKPNPIEQGYIIWHKDHGVMYAWWVPDHEVWEDADEYRYAHNEIDFWLKHEDYED